MAPDPSFQRFLEDIQKQNTKQFGAQLLQIKYEREIAGEDNDKREKQLDELIGAINSLQVAITGDVKVDFSNAEKILTKQLEELSLIRKLTEGSVEYDKQMAQYRNTSGRDVENLISGKTSKTGQVIDFETASDRLSGQGKRVRESERNQLNLTSTTLGSGVSVALGGKPKDKEDEVYKTFGEMVKDWKDLPGGILKDIKSFFGSGVKDAEADNVESTGELQLKASKEDLELTKQQKVIEEEQLKTLKEIRSSLDPSVPEFKNKKNKAESTVEPAKEEEGVGLSDLLPGRKTIGKALSKVGRLGKAASRGFAKLASSPVGKIGGAALAIGAGVYTAVTGYNEAEDSKQAKLEEVQKQLDAGQIDEVQAAKARNEIGNTATIEKSAAVGEGTGMAGGAIAGAAAGAALGSVVPIVGTAIGGLAGGALGAFAGTKAGKYVGEKVGQGINKVKEIGAGISDWFSNKKAELKDTYNRGISGSLAFQNQEEEIFKRAQAAGAIDERGRIVDSDKYNKISNQVEKEIKAADPSANRMADQEVSARESISDKSAGGVLSEDFRDGVTAEKSFLGSTTLGSLFSAKGLETGNFTGISATSKSGDGKEEQTFGEVLGRRISSGSLFKSDTYKVSAGDGEELEVSKSDYYKMQDLAKDGKTDEIKKMMADIRAERLTPLGEITGEMTSSVENVSPVTPAPDKRSASGQIVSQTSTENADMAREASRQAPPAIVSNNVTNTTKQSFTPVKAQPRSTSSLDRYQDRIAAY